MSTATWKIWTDGSFRRGLLAPLQRRRTAFQNQKHRSGRMCVQIIQGATQNPQSSRIGSSSPNCSSLELSCSA